jgi:hypothetical protein
VAAPNARPQPEPDPRLVLSKMLLDSLHRAWGEIDELRHTIARMEAGEHRFRCVGCLDTTWTKGTDPTPYWKHYPDGWRCTDCATLHHARPPHSLGRAPPPPPGA